MKESGIMDDLGIMTTIELLESEFFEAKSIETVTDIRDTALSGKNEASIALSFEIHTYGLIKEIFKKSIIPEKELSVKGRLINRGRIDSSYGEFIIEFKQPSAFKTAKQKKDAFEQLRDYLLTLHENNGQNAIGLLTDGLSAQFIRVENGFPMQESILPFGQNTLKRVVRVLLSLDHIALTSGNLIRDFCTPFENSLYRRIALKLQEELSQNPTEKTQMLFGEWKELFRLAHDDKNKQLAIELRKKALAEIFHQGVPDNVDEYQMLYALQTTYALIVKLIAYKVLSDIQFGTANNIKFREIVDLPIAQLRKILSDMEDGAIFRKAGILNLLEGDFFSWYVEPEQWSSIFSELIKEVVEILAKYEDKLLTATGVRTQDLFRELYEQIIPFEVRHSLGEFYTPPWLADLMVEESLNSISYRKNWTALDPCAGSGTFITKLLERVLEETSELERGEQLQSVLSRVVAVDLNPLAVLTTRVNYFINVSHLVDPSVQMHLPVYLGDSSYVAKLVMIDQVECYEYEIQTLKGPLRITLPKSALKSASKFSSTMTEVEADTKQLKEARILGRLESLCDIEDLTKDVRNSLAYLAKQLVDLERRGWNGIWARIVTNFLSTASLGRFDLIVGNPPWIDWKNLPEGYRERIKSICIDRHLFSGDRVTGGINLNICALIANVAADNWLKADGVLGFLMPSNMLFQQTYEGFRNFEISNQSNRLYLQQVLDFNKSGHPFKPVTYAFSGYFYKETEIDYAGGLPLKEYIKRKGTQPIETLNRAEHFSSIESNFKVNNSFVGTVDTSTTAFTYAASLKDLKKYRKIAGFCEYIGREGIEFYPQELFLLVPQWDMKAPKGRIYVKNFQNQKSKYRVTESLILLETKYLYPLVRGIEIDRYKIDASDSFLVPFPYEDSDMRLPISLDELETKSPLLASYLKMHRDLLEAQTNYNARIIGKKSQEFYALARVGEYSFEDVHVAYRDNSKWVAAVSQPRQMPWGETRRPLFQNHAPSLCERSDGKSITILEAHYVAGIFNSNLARNYILNSSDSRTFKIRPPIAVPLFDQKNSQMVELAKAARNLSNLAKKDKGDDELERRIETLYLEILE